MSRFGARVRLVLVLVAVATTLVGLAPDRTLLARLAAPHRWIGAVGADQAAAQCAGALLWLVACWVAVALVACASSRLPGVAGAAARRFAVRALPRWLRPLVVAATGAGLLVGPALASATNAVATTSATSHTAIAPAPVWPTDDPVPTPHWPTSPRATGPKTAPATTVPPKTAPPVTAPPKTVPPKTAPPTTAPPKTAPPTTAPPKTVPPSAPQVVTVHAGDSLWSIAASRLPSPHGAAPAAAQVARTWPAWFAANRAVIGDDPDLIHPGQHLRVPGTSTHRSTQGGQP